MAGSSHRAVHDLSGYGRPFWLAPGGWGNGLDDASWVAVVDVGGDHAASLLLMALRDRLVPGYAARLRPPLGTSGRSRLRDAPVRVWVGAGSYGKGQSVILEVLPDLVARLGPGVLRG